MARYRKYFPKISTPYLGQPAGQPVLEEDISDLPTDATMIALDKDSRNVDRLPRFKKVRMIDCTWFEDEWIELFERLPNLQHIELSLRKHTTLPSFNRLQKLRVLVASNCLHLDWRFLKGQPSLHSLCIGHCKAFVDADTIGSLSELRELYIDGPAEFDSLEPLAKLSQLQFLVLLIKVRKNVPSIRPIANLKKLTQLAVGLDFHIEDLDYLLESLPQIREIGLNVGLTWPPPDLPDSERPQKGKIRTKWREEGLSHKLAFKWL